MPAKLDNFRHRNLWIGRRVVYSRARGLARETVNGQPLADGTEATITDVMDFDCPYFFTLDTGEVIRSSFGLSWDFTRPCHRVVMRCFSGELNYTVENPEGEMVGFTTDKYMAHELASMLDEKED